MRWIATVFALLLSVTGAHAQNTLFAANPGDMIVRGTLAWQAVPGGLTGYLLCAQGPAAPPVWCNFTLPAQATNTILGNVTGGNASPSAISVSSALDTIGYDTVRPPSLGSILYKSATTWQALDPGPLGWVLTGGGVGTRADWAQPVGSVAPGVAGTCLISTGVFPAAPAYLPCVNSVQATLPLSVNTVAGVATFAIVDPLAVTYGGTGLATLTSNALFYGNGTGVVQEVVPVANATLTTSAGSVPVLSQTLPTAVQGNITTVGTVATGVWSGTAIAVAKGGTACVVASGTCLDNITGFSTTGIASRTGAGAYTFSTQSALLDAIGSTRGQVLYRGAAAWSALNTGTTGQVFTANGAGADPSWTTLAGTGTVTSVICGTGLSGGTITISGTCALDINALAQDTAPVLTTDFLATYDDSAATSKKVLATNLSKGFRANKNAVNQTGIINGTDTLITFGTEVFDVGGFYDPSTSRWTPPPGLVSIGGTYSATNVTSVCQLRVFKNGVYYVRGPNTYHAADCDAAVHFVDQANGTDYYQLYINADSGGTITVDGTAANTYFYGKIL